MGLVYSCCGYGQGREGMPGNLLSGHVGIVVCLGLEATVVGPEVNGNADASDTAFVNLRLSAYSSVLQIVCAHHFCCLRPCDLELHVRISLPEAIKQRVPREETVVCLSCRCDSLRARVAIQATLLRFGGANQLLPVLELFGVGCLLTNRLACEL